MNKNIYSLIACILTVPSVLFAQNVGVDIATPEQKLDVDGAIKIGNTFSGVAGSLRWNGTEFQFHDGTSWISLTANTDDQTITDFSVSGQTLSLTLESGNTMNLNLGPTLSAADDQTITDLSISGNVLSITVENGNTTTLDLSPTLNTADDQQLTLVGDDLSIDNGNTVDLSSVDDQTITDLSVTGNTLSITLENGNTETLDLTTLLDNNDNQTVTDLSVTGNVLSITLENGNTETLDLTTLLANNDDQAITDFSLSGTELTLDIDNNGNGPQMVDLDPLRRQLIDGTTNLNNTWVRVAADNGTNNDLIRMTTNGSERMRIDDSGNVGIGTGADALTNRLRVEVNSNSLEYPLMIRNAGASNGSGTGAGIAFNNHNANVAKMAIVSERTSDNSIGKMHFALSNTADNVPVNIGADARITILSNGNVGVGEVDPAVKFEVAGDASVRDKLGIGTTGPSENLHVVGGARVTSLGAGVVQSSATGVLSSGSLAGTGLGDNLGNHSATLDLDMNDLNILDANTVQANTLLDPDDATLTVSDNLTVTGDLTVQGGDVYDNSGNLRLNGEDNVYISMDYNNNDGNNRAIMFGRNDEGGSTNWNELMRIAENGNVGIGTNNPSQKLHVAGNIQMGDGAWLDDDGTMGEFDDDWIRLRGYIEMRSNTDNYGIVLRDKNSTSYFGITQVGGASYLTDASTYTNYFIRGDGANAKVRGNLAVGGLGGSGDRLVTTDNAGNLTGTTDFGSLIDVNNGLIWDATFQDIRLGGTLIEATTITHGVHTLDHNLTGNGDFRVLDNGNYVFRVLDNGNTYIGNGSGGGQDLYIADRIFDWDNTGYYLDIGGVNRVNEIMADDGTAGDVSYHFSGDSNTGMYQPGDNQIAFSINGTPRVRIDGSGDVGIGTTNPTYKLHVAGRLKTTGINETSDVRLKKDIEEIENALSTVTKLNGVTYNWREDEFPEMGLNDEKQFGLIAQEVEKVIPELVKTDEEGWKSIEYTHLVPVLIEAIKEQQQTIEMLEGENASLSNETRTLKAQLDKNTSMIKLIMNNLNEGPSTSKK